MTVTLSENLLVPVPMRILRVTVEMADTFTLELDASGRDGGFRFAPGQFNMLYVFGAGEVPISMSGDPVQPEFLIHTVRAVGGVTESMRRLQAGDSLGVRGPYGSAWPMAEAAGKDLLLVAGGLGLAPLRPAIYHAMTHRASFRRVSILYGARSPAELLFTEQLAAWRGRGDMQVEVTVDRAGTEYHGHIGVVPALVPAGEIEAENTIAMVCGPEVMMRFTARALLARGVSEKNIYLSMERNMKCAVGFCGHCQFGPTFVCKDGPVYPLDRLAWLFGQREI